MGEPVFTKKGGGLSFVHGLLPVALSISSALHSSIVRRDAFSPKEVLICEFMGTIEALQND